MRLRDDELLGLRVETSTGRYVGRLVGFVVDTETGFIAQYRVRPRGVIAACFPGMRELLIARDQVVSMDARRMIIHDGATGDAANRRQKHMAPAMNPQPLSVESE